MSTEYGNERGTEQMVADYLAQLEREAERLERNARQELLEDVRSHIDVALAEAENPDRDEVARILGALGEPRVIVDAASSDGASSDGASSGDAPPTVVAPVVAPVAASTEWDSGGPYPLGGREVGAILLLLFGGFLFGVGWLFGLWLLWTSARWTTRSKLLGTFVLPGGLVPIVLTAGMETASSSCTSMVGDGPPQCTQSGTSWSHWPAATLAVLLVVLPFVTAFLLWRQARTVRPTAPIGGVAAALTIGFAAVLGLMVIGGGAFLVAGSSMSSTQPADPVPATSVMATTSSSFH